eukprot:2370601-Rhodomonas_salina.4
MAAKLTFMVMLMAKKVPCMASKLTFMAAKLTHHGGACSAGHGVRDLVLPTARRVPEPSARGSPFPRK